MQQRHGARAASPALTRALVASLVVLGTLIVVLATSPGPAGASGIVPPADPSASVPPQVMPRCTTTPVDDTSAGCIDSVLHNINQARSLENLGPLVLPSTYAG